MLPIYALGLLICERLISKRMSMESDPTPLTFSLSATAAADVAEAADAFLFPVVSPAPTTCIAAGLSMRVLPGQPPLVVCVHCMLNQSTAGSIQQHPHNPTTDTYTPLTLNHTKRYTSLIFTCSKRRSFRLRGSVSIISWSMIGL